MLAPCGIRTAQRESASSKAYINLDSISLGCAAHMSFREEAIGEKGEKNKLRKRQQFVPRQNEARATKLNVSDGSTVAVQLLNARTASP